MSSFEQIVRERRSASNFIEGQDVSVQELDEIFELVKFAPSAFNLQHTKYMVVLDSALKEEIKKAAYGQHKVSTASAAIVVLGDTKAHQDTARIYEGLLMLGVLNKQEYDQVVQDTHSFYENRGQTFQRDESIRNASLAAMLFMMAAKNKGWDTCPMIGFDSEKIKQVLSISDRYEPVMMITLGKEKTESRKPRGDRKPVNEFVTYL
ncbi:MAG TPA: nitroreductase family protein [Bacillus sp. (in: firmicutes)]|nr:nitroreductase family protein [Bacillus sp. (in: firmicutes)]